MRRVLEASPAGRCIIIQAPTGSGKSTQVPQMLLRSGLVSGQVVILEPRRLAARLLAKRVASEVNTDLGGVVGYQIRFESCVSAETRVRYVTEGVLLRQMVGSRDLKGVDVLIFDEFHERHLYGDVTLAQAVQIQRTTRPDLVIIVMSATLEVGILRKYLPSATVLQSEGRTFPVEITYCPPKRRLLQGREVVAPVWEQAASAFTLSRQRGDEGDVLIFMPGSFEIHRTLEALRSIPQTKGYVLLPLHGELPTRDQDAAMARYDTPKIVVATNVAETSLTIDGVTLVIDSGLARIPKYDAVRGINTLLIERISQSSANQRAGRAGRTAPGQCMRLWSEREQEMRPVQELPEVQRLDLSEVLLTLKALGAFSEEVCQPRFQWLEEPEEMSLSRAETLLRSLGATNKEGKITALGRKMLAFPVHPRYARLLLSAKEYGCVEEAALIAALTQGRGLLLRNGDRDAREDLLGEEHDSDFWFLMRAWQYVAERNFDIELCRKLGVHAVTARQVKALFAMFLRIAEKERLFPARDIAVSPEEKDIALRKCVLTAFSDRVARRADTGTLRCFLPYGRMGMLTRESVVQEANLFVAAEISEIEGRDKSVSTLLSMATAIEPEWLEEIYTDEIHATTVLRFDTVSRCILGEEQLVFREIPLERKSLTLQRTARGRDPELQDKAAAILAEEVLSGRLILKHWDHSIEQWIVRLNCLAGSCPELGLPAMNEEEKRSVILDICHGAYSYKEIKEVDVKTAVKSWLSYEQNRLLDKYMPERLELSNGRRAKLTYVENGNPFIALRIQELFDVKQLPKIAMGRIPIVVHILAPNMRPVQVTQDLASFWTEVYPRVKSELQRKYPKHKWL